jgi:hypothetical protein
MGQVEQIAAFKKLQEVQKQAKIIDFIVAGANSKRENPSSDVSDSIISAMVAGVNSKKENSVSNASDEAIISARVAGANAKRGDLLAFPNLKGASSNATGAMDHARISSFQ